MTATGMGRAPSNREEAEALDRSDPLAGMRDAFHMPEGLIYLDGNSLGPLAHNVRERVRDVVEREWGDGLIGSWNAAGWVDLPRRVGDKIARLIGAPEASVVAADSTSVNLFKVLAAAIALNPSRRVIVSERSNFPTDLYIAEGLAALAGQGHELRLVNDPADIPAVLDETVAAVMLTHVSYRTGLVHDMAATTRMAHDCGALAIWDLAHSAGAMPLDLTGADADFAIGCGYKYLNGGPGAPAFLYVAPRLQGRAVQPLSGWFGHAAPFRFDSSYQPADGIDRFLTGTPAVLSMSALDAALDLFETVDMAGLREKSVALCELFLARVEALCGEFDVTLVSPRDASVRGSQISFAHPGAYAVMQALIARGVIGDFRAPDILRFGFAPLYTRFVDAFDAAEILSEVLASGEWRRPEFGVRRAVT
ncbi:kynureninase [Aurantimonas sp. VKM B-3413]|uniref:kynureninase n=1 Tax=Aurantimonas sp. VKM B-3413 TaxID=2779401 RepID=UPI001E33D9BF|nr:kynureninase [Aurantimonas sp. VKM B-3413]MCB8840289.1 kynureninase [Aurantimonas sp. VKM B-3413]